MRRPLLAAILASSLVLVACSDQPTAPTERTTPPAAGPALTEVCSTELCIQNLINALFPKGDLLKSASSMWANIQTKVKQGRLKDAQAKATELVTFGLKNFSAGKLIGGMGSTTQSNLADLSAALFEYTGSSGVPVIPAGALGPDGAAVIITPQSPTTLVLTGTKQAGASVPAGAAPTTTLLSIVRLPDSPGPLRTSLDQYPLFYHFATSPEVTFNLDVTNGVCQSQTLDITQLRLAHNVSPFGFGDVEILPRVDAPFLDCSNLAGPVGTLEHRGLFGFASAGWSLLGRTVGPVATAILLPDELHAAALETCCLGGTLKKYSEFGAVNPGSNPASLNYNPNEAAFSGLSAPAGTPVSPPPSVVVKSQNGTPIAKVPVVFAVTAGGGAVTGGGTVNGSSATVLTDANGVASLTSWTLGASGTNTVRATPPAVPQDPIPATPTYRPAAAFSPLSRDFTATATSFGFETGEAAWAPTGFWNRNTLSGLSNSAYPDFVTTFDDDDVPGGTLPAPFAGTYAAWYGQPSTGNYIGIQVEGDGDNSGGMSKAPNSGTFRSPSFRVPDISGVEATFQTWWEIESVNPHSFDLMEVVVLDATGTTVLGTTRLNPSSDPADGAAQLPYSSVGGFNAAPSWEQIDIDLSAQRGQIVRLRFDFNTIDERYNGFRGWIVDQVQVQIPTFSGPLVTLEAGLRPSRKLVPVDRATFPPAGKRP